MRVRFPLYNQYLMSSHLTMIQVIVSTLTICVYKYLLINLLTQCKVYNSGFLV